MAVDINKPQTDNNSGFGLPKGEFKPIESTENRKWLRTTLIIAGVVLVAGAGVVFWLFKDHPGKDFVTKTLQRHQEEDTDFKEEAPVVPTEPTAPVTTEIKTQNHSSKDESLSELKAISADFTTTPTPHQEVQQELPIMVIHAPMGLYHIIVASHIDMDLTRDYAKKLSKKGIYSKIIPPRSGKHFARLSIAQAPTLEEAKQKVNELKGEYGDHIWIMKY